MITGFDPAQRADPQFFLTCGVPQPGPQKPERTDALLTGVHRLGGPVITPPDAGLALIAARHPARYLTFLHTIQRR